MDPKLTPPESAPAVVLSYERGEKPSRAPMWVRAIAVIYALIMLTLLGLPAFAKYRDAGGEETTVIIIAVLLLVAAWGSLLLIPVQIARRRTVERRALWIPLAGSGAACGFLMLGASMAVGELFKMDYPWLLIAIPAVGWVAWSVIFALIALPIRPLYIGTRLHRYLIAGSALELLVAVPAHVIVRRRTECCAGYLTGLGICLGIAVAVVAFGPSVFLLYWRRTHDITSPNRQS